MATFDEIVTNGFYIMLGILGTLIAGLLFTRNRETAAGQKAILFIATGVILYLPFSLAMLSTLGSVFLGHANLAIPAFVGYSAAGLNFIIDKTILASLLDKVSSFVTSIPPAGSA
jgi:hypothetical protein